MIKQVLVENFSNFTNRMPRSSLAKITKVPGKTRHQNPHHAVCQQQNPFQRRAGPTGKKPRSELQVDQASALGQDLPADNHQGERVLGRFARELPPTPVAGTSLPTALKNLLF
ncbi:hypothetical protein MC885_001240 [Smutsia gigantea]|nr:hypothetical protein MC885_001240 [Smutsia gigantea]